MDSKDFFDRYAKFVDSVTSETSQKDKLFAKRMEALSEKLAGNYARLDNAVAGLSGESGEIADLWKKIKFHQLEFDEQMRDKLIKELGDVCWYLCLASNALNISIEEIIEKNIEKLQARHPHGFSAAYLDRKKDD